MKIDLSNSEWKLMNRLWQNAPMTITELTAALREDTGWSKNTVITMLSRLEGKNAVRHEEGRRAKLYFPAVVREDAIEAETETFLLRCLPEQVVERTSGAGEAEGSLHLYLSGLREGIHGLQQQPSEVLLPCLLYCLSVWGCTPWIRGRFKMKQLSR